MKIFQGVAVVIAGLLMASPLVAAETGRISKPRILVRAQPSQHAEIVTKLQQGDEVIILEEVTNPNPKAGEPANWLRIKMPANVPVWVFAPYLNTSEKTVNVSRLNLRAGPGENYSVVGRLERGAAVREIRTVEEWMEVETPEEAYAFIAAGLVEGGTNSAQVAQQAPPTDLGEQTPPAQAAPAAQEPRQQTPPPVTQNEPVDLGAQAPIAAAPASRAVSQPSSQPLNRQQTTPQATSRNNPPDLQESRSPTPGARVVRREGIVRSTRNIHAPTYEELINAETRATMNFLYTGPNGASLKRFRGQKVVVTGEEGIDPKWPKIPVIEIVTIEPAPDAGQSN